MRVAVVGGGPAGLRAAEVAAAGGVEVTVYEAMPSVGRKFLVAGKGGLNLTNTEPCRVAAGRYSGGEERWRSLLADFDPGAMRAWAAGLGIETFAASTGRVYPRELRAAPLLRRWRERLMAAGVRFAVRHRWTGLEPGLPLRLHFAAAQGQVTVEADAVVLALGGGSWPSTGSDGGWVPVLAALGVGIAPLQAANCGWEVAWSPDVLAAEGLPLKNIVVRGGAVEVPGELLITGYGLEGGALYRSGAALRAMSTPMLEIDLKPSFTVEELARKLGDGGLANVAERWRLSPAAVAVLGFSAQGASLAHAAKHCVVPLLRPRPLAEAISTAGGVRWTELDDDLGLVRLPGVYVAGEMIDWEAPTGGWLLQGCFATGTRAGLGALRKG